MKVDKLSIIIPSYNEGPTIVKTINMVKSVNLGGIKKEIIVINDGSTDDTRVKLKKITKRNIKVINKRENQGKGAAIREGLKQISGKVVVIQDADLEYDPEEYKLLLKPMLEGKAEVVYGSRFVTTEERRVMNFWHSIGNKVLTLLSNSLTNLNLTDMETCYKMFTKDIAEKLDIKEKRFGFEPEFTAKVAKMKCRIYEVGISYHGRSYREGKKIGWRDGVIAIWIIIKYNLLK